MVSAGALALAVSLAATTGCAKKKESSPTPTETTNAASDQPQAPVPGAMPTPETPKVVGASQADIDALLAELTRELRRTMIGRKLSGSFEEFVAIRNLQVPPPPPGKKYAINKQWRVVLVDAK